MLAALAWRWKFDKTDLLRLAVATTILMPYLLPKIHDRYFYPADVLTFALAIVEFAPATVALTIAIQLGSLSAYLSALFNYRWGPYLGALFMSLGVVLVVRQLTASLASRTEGGGSSTASTARVRTSWWASGAVPSKH